MRAPVAPFVSVVLAVLLLAGTARAAGDSPDELVKRTTNEVLEVIKQNRDRAVLRRIAEQKVLPNFDFQEMTRLAMGPAWRKASPEQRKGLVDNFRTLLVNTYVNSFAQVGSGERTLEVKPAAIKGDETMVRTLVKEPGRPQPISIDYRMRNKDDGWKVYDIVVEGVSLVTNYRTTFAEEVNRGGVDGLIKALEQRNKKLASG